MKRLQAKLNMINEMEEQGFHENTIQDLVESLNERKPVGSTYDSIEDFWKSVETEKPDNTQDDGETYTPDGMLIL